MSNLPDGWYLSVMSDIAIERGIQTGPFGSQLKASEYSEDGIPVVMPSDLTGYRISTASIARIPVKLASELSRHKLQIGDIIFGRRGDIGRCALVTENENGWICGTGCLRVRLSLQKAIPEFVIQYLDLPQAVSWLQSNAVGQTMLNLNTTILSELPLYLPPLPEQGKIADILSTWDEAIALVEALIAALTERKKGLMQGLLTGEVRDSWEVAKLSDVAEVILSGVDKKSYEDQDTVHLCNYTNVFNNAYITSDLPFMVASASDTEIEKCRLNLHDVIITKDSETAEEIAQAAVVIEDLANVICGYHLAILRPEEQKVFGPFLREIIMSPDVHNRFEKFANGVTRFGLTLKSIESVEIPFPSLVEQREISTLFQLYDLWVAGFYEYIDHLRQQKKGLMQGLLTGEVRVQVGEE